MSNENTTASQMQHPENEKLQEANLALKKQVKELHEMVDDLSGWVAGVEADNDTLRKEIARLKEERNEIRRSFCQMVCDYEADAHGNMDTSKEQVATNNGWDCFAEKLK
jgi:peptidoglycan hydrolase CwlO-like protein